MEWADDLVKWFDGHWRCMVYSFLAGMIFAGALLA